MLEHRSAFGMLPRFIHGPLAYTENGLEEI
jgi:hypothetical protein